MTHLTPSTIRLDAPAKGKPCGAGYIPSQKNCTKGSSSPTKQGKTALTAGAIGLGVVAAGAGAFALSRRSTPKPQQQPKASNPWDEPFTPRPPKPTSPSKAPATPALPGRTPPTQLSGTSPRALLPPAPPRKSKTQRMRENTRAAMQVAEGRIAQTAREEVRRVAQIGNTMAAAGEATGMAVKTGLREVRLRTEAARRRFEPGYRSGTPATPKAPAQLPEGGSAFQAPVNPKRTRPPEYVEELGRLSTEELRQWISTDPRTGQPKRRKAQGFGRSTRDNYIPHYAPVTLSNLR